MPCHEVSQAATERIQPPPGSNKATEFTIMPPEEHVSCIKYSLYGERPYEPLVPGHGDLLRVIGDEIKKTRPYVKA